MPDIIPTPQTLPDGFCPTSWQDTLNEFAASMIVTIPSSFGQIIISQTTPAPADNAKIWFKVDANNKVLGIYSYSSLVGGWVLADDFPYYFQDTGVADAIAITTGENIALNVDIQGRFFFIRIAAANATTAPTFQVDIAPVTAIKKYGSTAIAAGDFAAGMIAILLYDGTQFQFLNPVIQIPAAAFTKSFTSDPIAIGTAGTTGTPVPHGLGVYPKIISSWLRCTADDVGIVSGQQIPLNHFGWHTVAGGQDQSGNAIPLECDDTNVTPIWNYNDSSNLILFKHLADTQWTQIDTTKWVLIFTLAS